MSHMSDEIIKLKFHIHLVHVYRASSKTHEMPLVCPAEC